MSDRYKFRGKRIATGEWVIGNVLEDATGLFIHVLETYKHKAGDTHISHTHKVDLDTVSQCTGLTDKNGRMIFEGDVVTDGRIQTRVIAWDDLWAQWAADILDADGATVDGDELGMLSKAYFIEVIGNRWDDGDLLGGQS